jgi:hypothetical protein
MFARLQITCAAMAGVWLMHALPAQAAGAFESALGADAAKIAAKAKVSMMNGDNEGRENGNGLTPYLKKLGKPPARVALITFYVWDIGNSKSNSYSFLSGNYKYTVSNTRSYNVGTGELSVLASELHDAAIGPLKQSFAAVGMQLLTPQEFLDTPDRKQAYESFKFEHKGISGLLRTLQTHTDLEWSRGVPDGYKLIEVITRGSKKTDDFELGMTGIGIGKFANAAGNDLVKQLGVDAVLMIYSPVQAEKAAINMLGVGMYMFGPNPIAEAGQNMYYGGHQYSGLYLKTKEVPFITTDKNGKLINADFQGFGPVVGAMGARMAEHIKKKTG